MTDPSTGDSRRERKYGSTDLKYKKQMIENFLSSHGLYGITVGALTFLVIGVFHPIVIKAEYYFGTRSWWGFLLLGIVCLVLSIFTRSTLGATLLGVVGFSSLWSILEVFEQKKRVEKGWFPTNHKRASKHK